MIINENLQKNLLSLKQNVDLIVTNNSLTDLQIENFLRNFEKTRYNILSEIKLYNKNVEFEYEKIKTIDNEYKAELIDNVLKIYVPEVMPSYKNLKTHTHKRILLNIAEITKQYEGQFDNEVCIYIKLFDKILGWDVDNKFIKPIADALILSKVIQDDNMSKMSYCVKGEFSEIPHTEIYVFDSKNMDEFLAKYST
ncbi:MAG: hypothetical protein ACI4U4_03640 [Bacilli bacterium]